MGHHGYGYESDSWASGCEDSCADDTYEHKEHGHGYGGNWVWWIVVIIIIIIIICIIWFAFAQNNNNNKNNQKEVKFEAVLNGKQETSCNNSPATGAGTFTLSSDQKSLTYDITVFNLNSRVLPSHFHLGKYGMNGPAVKTLDAPEVTGSRRLEFTGTWSCTDEEPLTQDRVNELLEGNIYVNIHTVTHPDGEIRGQVNQA